MTANFNNHGNFPAAAATAFPLISTADFQQAVQEIAFEPDRERAIWLWQIIHAYGAQQAANEATARALGDARFYYHHHHHPVQIQQVPVPVPYPVEVQVPVYVEVPVPSAPANDNDDDDDAASDRDLQHLAHRTGVDFAALKAFLRSDEVRWYARELIRAIGAHFLARGEGEGRSGWTAAAWRRPWSRSPRLLWLRDRMAEGPPYGNWTAGAGYTWGNADAFRGGRAMGCRGDGSGVEEDDFVVGEGGGPGGGGGGGGARNGHHATDENSTRGKDNNNAFRSNDLRPWIFDKDDSGECGPQCGRCDAVVADKHHFTRADHMARFVLLCEHARVRSGRPEWATERFARPGTRLDLYQGLILLLLRQEATRRTRRSALQFWHMEVDPVEEDPDVEMADGW